LCSFEDKESHDDDQQSNDEEFWKEKVGYTPETRTLIQNKLHETREKADKSRSNEPTKEK